MSSPHTIILLGALPLQGNISERWLLNVERNNRRGGVVLKERQKHQEMRKVCLESSCPAWSLKSPGWSPIPGFSRVIPAEQAWFFILTGDSLVLQLLPQLHSSLWIYGIFCSDAAHGTRISYAVILSLTIGKTFQIQMLPIWASKLIWVWGRYCRTWKEQLQPHLFRVAKFTSRCEHKSCFEKF